MILPTLPKQHKDLYGAEDIGDIPPQNKKRREKRREEIEGRERHISECKGLILVKSELI